MFDGILEAQEKLIDEIYSVDQNNFDAVFLDFLDNLEVMINKMSHLGYEVDITAEMMEIQKSYKKRDLTELSDYILYTFKPAILELKDAIESK